jgi:uncharacterized protein (TIGR02646 family)
MRALKKDREPVSLQQYRSQSGAIYDGPLFTPVKEDIRESLLREQGHLCAYCMQRIRTKTMKIEHWRCQDHYATEQLSYNNMLGVCHGNEGQPPANQTCDTRKGNNDILYNPADPAHHSRMQIRYDGAGKISSGDKQFDSQINSILNLNWTRLKENRKRVWDAITTVLSKTPGPCTRAQITDLIAKWNIPDKHGMMKEYCGVAIYYLARKLNRTS